MEPNTRKAFDTLKRMGVPVYDHGEDGTFIISAEENTDDNTWADYYDGPSLEHLNKTTGEWEWSFGVNPKIERALDKFGLYAEWINPGSLGVYE